MIYTQEKEIDKDIMLFHKFYGRCKDDKHKVWWFYTNSKIQYNLFKDRKILHGMRLVNWQINKKNRMNRRMLRVIESVE